MWEFLRKPLSGYLAGATGVILVALALWPFYPHVRSLTAGNSLLVVVLVVALIWGMTPALVTSVLGALYLNFFFVPPLMKFDFRVDGMEDVIGLATFLITSIVVGQLSYRSQQRRREVERLYSELRMAFERASQVEGIRRSEQFKSALLDTVTHDLRTPLTSIKGAASTLINMRSDAALEAPARIAEDQLLEIIVKQADVLNRFIQSMIELAEIESSQGKVRDGMEATPLDEIVIAALARAEDALRDHQIEVQCDDRLSTTGHAKAIAQVLFSLLENAGKYSPPGTTVRVAANEDASGGLRVAVEDEGPGVPPRLREKVFDKFFRGEASDRQGNLRPAAAGLGLGLTIARRIVDAQGGRVWVEARSDGKTGARFVVTLPTAPAAVGAATPALQEPVR